MRIGVNGVIPYVSLKIFGSCWGIPICRWGSPDPQRSDCGFTIHAGRRPAVILPVDLEIHRGKGIRIEAALDFLSLVNLILLLGNPNLSLGISGSPTL